MNFRSRLSRLEKLKGKGLKVIVPTVEFHGGDGENCTYATASWGDDKSFKLNRRNGESFPDFETRFVEGYLIESRNQSSSERTKTVVLEHDADLL